MNLPSRSISITENEDLSITCRYPDNDTTYSLVKIKDRTYALIKSTDGFYKSGKVYDFLDWHLVLDKNKINLGDYAACLCLSLSLDNFRDVINNGLTLPPSATPSPDRVIQCCSSNMSQAVAGCMELMRGDCPRGFNICGSSNQYDNSGVGGCVTIDFECTW